MFQKKEPDFSYDEAVIIDILFEGFDEFGSSEEQKQIYKLEDKLANVLPEGSGIDGHEFGEGTCTVYIYGSSADSIFKSIEEQLRHSNFQHIDITLQYGDPEDPETKDKKFSL